MAFELPEHDALIHHATKEDLVDTAKLLAVAVSLYRQRFGDLDLPGNATPAAAREQANELEGELACATRTFLAVLAEVVRGGGSSRLH